MVDVNSLTIPQLESVIYQCKQELGICSTAKFSSPPTVTYPTNNFTINDFTKAMERCSNLQLNFCSSASTNTVSPLPPVSSVTYPQYQSIIYQCVIAGYCPYGPTSNSSMNVETKEWTKADYMIYWNECVSE